MFLELIATFAAGIGAAGVAMLVNRISGGRLPGWIIPVAAGIAMLGYTLWSEYSWAGRTAANFPPGVVVVREVEQKFLWKPWTYFGAPQTTRLIAVDKQGIRRNPNAPETRLVDLLLFARWRPPAMVPQLVDCAARARADVTDAALADPAGSGDWIELDAEDPLFRMVCTE